MSLAELGESVTFGEALDLVDQLQLETGSHLSASVNGHQWASTWGERHMFLLNSRHLNIHRDEKKHPQPIDLPAPWDEVTAPEPEPTPEELEAARARLRSVSAFRDRE